ncbi:MAG: hypothetical protein F6K14_25400 [Symploca sp. SIO2C1]|nr:hypothetical protein [Symploca sp. SIO2C1]
MSNNPQKKQKNLQRIIAICFVLQAAIIGVRGNLDALSGKPALNTIPRMIIQGVALIIKAKGAEKKDHKKRSQIYSTIDNEQWIMDNYLSLKEED